MISYFYFIKLNILIFYSCNSNPKPPSQIKILLAGSDSFVNYVLRQYVEQLSFKPPDWMNYIKFYIIPLGNKLLFKSL